MNKDHNFIALSKKSYKMYYIADCIMKMQFHVSYDFSKNYFNKHLLLLTK